MKQLPEIVLLIISLFCGIAIVTTTVIASHTNAISNKTIYTIYSYYNIIYYICLCGQPHIIIFHTKRVGIIYQLSPQPPNSVNLNYDHSSANNAI